MDDKQWDIEYLPVKYSTWWFKNFVFFVGTFFFIHLAMAYSSLAGFSISTSAPPGPVYSCKQNKKQVIIKCTVNIRTPHTHTHADVHQNAVSKYIQSDKRYASVTIGNQNRCRWHIWCMFVYSKIHFATHAYWKRPHTKFKNVGIAHISWFVLVSYARQYQRISSYDFHVYHLAKQKKWIYRIKLTVNHEHQMYI